MTIFLKICSYSFILILELLIRYFENFKVLFPALGFSFSVICFIDMRMDKVDGNSLYELFNYINKHQITDDCKEGGVPIYNHNYLSFKLTSNVCINSVDIESLSLEIHLTLMLMSHIDHLMVK